jgi:hypothetical protein
MAWFGDVGTRLSWEATLDMVVERCGRCLETLRWCLWVLGSGEVAFWETRVVTEELGEAFSTLAGSVTSVLDETRCRRFLTLLDLERLWCLLRVVSAERLATVYVCPTAVRYSHDPYARLPLDSRTVAGASGRYSPFHCV